MRVLLDENLPHDLARAIPGHAVSTVQGLGWAGTKNGALLKRATGECDVFVTMDGNIEHQQDFANLPVRRGGHRRRVEPHGRPAARHP